TATEEHPVELIGHFVELSEAERAAPAVSGRMLGDKWILKKAFWCAEQDSWKESYYSLSQEESFTDWPEPATSWGAFPEQYVPLIGLLADRGNRPSAARLDELRNIVRERKPELITLLDPKWVPNPGGGGNWKSNANSILPRPIFIHAVQEAS